MAGAVVYPNEAGDSDMREAVKTELLPMLTQIRNERRTLRETWLRYTRMWSATPDREAYQGRARVYIPIVRKLIDNWVRRIKRDLIPRDEWFVNRPLRRMYEDREQPLHRLLMYFFQNHTRLRRQMDPWLRQLVTLGSSPVKVLWQQEERELPILRDVLDPDGNPTGDYKVEHDTVIDRIGPTFRPVDLFAWYIHPVTCQDVDEATIIFEDLMMTPSRLQALAETAIIPEMPELGTIYDADGVEKLLTHFQGYSNATREKIEAESRRLSDKGFTHPLDYRMPAYLRPIDVTQVYWKRDLNRDSVPERYWVEIGADDVPIRIQREPWWHGRPPWLCGKLVEIQNEFYGRGLPEVVDRLQYFANDIANQSLDALVWCLNPISIVDMYRVQDPTSIRMRPGAKWLADPNAVKFAEPPQDIPVAGFAALSTVSQIMRDVADVAPIGGAAQRGKKQMPAAQTQLLIQEAEVDVHDVVEGIEDGVMVPFLKIAHSLTLQCLDRPIILRIAGGEGKSILEQKIDVLDVIGDFEFQWLGSVTSMNQQIRSQQMINFLQMVIRIPPEQQQQQGFKIVLPHILRMIWSQGMGLPDPDRVVEDLSPKPATDPTLENDLFLQNRGKDVYVSEGDDNAKHTQVHQALLARPDLPFHVRQQIMAHLQAHQAAEITKKLLAQQKQMQQQLAQMGPQGAPNGAMKPTSMNPGRPAQTTSISDVMKGAPRGT